MISCFSGRSRYHLKTRVSEFTATLAPEHRRVSNKGVNPGDVKVTTLPRSARRVGFQRCWSAQGASSTYVTPPRCRRNSRPPPEFPRNTIRIFLLKLSRGRTECGFVHHKCTEYFIVKHLNHFNPESFGMTP